MDHHNHREIQTAIRRSITHDEIVTIDYTEEAHAVLAVVCDDSVDARSSYSMFEFWGTDNGEEWRVHLHDASYDRKLDDDAYDIELDRLAARRAHD